MLTNVGSNKSGSEVCSRRLPIFDGKQRYDLKLTYKTTKRVTADRLFRPRLYLQGEIPADRGTQAGR